MINYLIVVLFLIILLLDFTDKKNIQEHYTVERPFGSASPNAYNRSQSAININAVNKPKLKNFGNFNIIGKFPTIPIEESCYLDFDSTNFPYDIDEKNQSVSRKCNPNAINKNYNDLSMPLYVMSRTAGRPRQIRQIN